MLTSITIQTNQWQQINLFGAFRNNRNVYLMIQNTANNSIVPTSNGLMIQPFETFIIPDDGTQYWAKYVSGSGELIEDPTLKFAVNVVPSAINIVSVFDSGADIFAGVGSFVEIDLNVANENLFQAVITPKGLEAEALTIGSISVVYVSKTKFRVINTGSAGMNFDWKAIKN